MTPFTACDTYRYFAGRALLMTSQKKVTHRIFIIVLDSYFNFTKKSDLVGNL